MGLLHSMVDAPWGRPKSTINEVPWEAEDVVYNEFTPGRPGSNDNPNPYERYRESKFDSLAYRHVDCIRSPVRKPVFPSRVPENVPELLLGPLGS